jgi:glutamate--cysteine ligase
MTVRGSTTETVPPAQAAPDVLAGSTDPVETARRHIAESALTENAGGQVGLELEFHLVDLAHPGRRPRWAQARELALGAGTMPAGSLVTLEPGGQIELSTPPARDVAAAVAALRADREALRVRLREAGFGAAPLGADLARPVERINPSPRYLAMEEHFDALGCAGSGKSMMSATAALQVNLDAGPASGWQDRLSLIQAMVPMLVAASSTSPYLGGHSSGWHSMRQGTWQGIDHSRSDPVPRGEPTAAWADYALEAPVMLVRDGDELRAVTERRSFGSWLRGDPSFGRAPTMADLEYHLTTLFPPVRPRGYVEIRCLDALPDRWWPAVAALTTVLVDDPVAADAAADACAPVAHVWEAAARDGLGDPEIRRAVTRCVEIAARRCPEALRTEIEGFAELISSGRTPSGELRRRVMATSPLAVLEEEAHA